MEDQEGALQVRGESEWRNWRSGRAQNDVGEAVGVDVAGPRNAFAQRRDRVRKDIGVRGRGVITDDTCRAAQEHDRGAAAAGHSDDDIVEAVAVDVPGPGNAFTHATAEYFGKAERVRPKLLMGILETGAGNPGQAAQEHQGHTAITLAVVGRDVGIEEGNAGSGAADDDIGKAVAVDIASARDAIAEERVDFVRNDPGVGQCGVVRPLDSGRAAEIYEGRALDRPEPEAWEIHRASVEIRSHHDVIEAVAVDIAGAGNAPAQPCRGIVRLDACEGRGGVGTDDPVQAAEKDEGRALFVLAAVPAPRTHDDVGEAVAVDVAGPRHAPAEAGGLNTGRTRLVRFQERVGHARDQRIDHHRIMRSGIIDHQPQTIGRWRFETRYQDPPGRVLDLQLAVAKPAARISRQFDRLADQPRARMSHGELKHQRPVALRAGRQRESLLQPLGRVLIPFDDAGPADLDPLAGPVDHARRDRGKRLAAPQSGQRKTGQPRRTRRGAIMQPDPGGPEIGAQIMGAVGRLQSLRAVARMILGLGKSALYVAPPIGADTARRHRRGGRPALAGAVSRIRRMADPGRARQGQCDNKRGEDESGDELWRTGPFTGRQALETRAHRRWP